MVKWASDNFDSGKAQCSLFPGSCEQLHPPVGQRLHNLAWTCPSSFISQYPVYEFSPWVKLFYRSLNTSYSPASLCLCSHRNWNLFPCIFAYKILPSLPGLILSTKYSPPHPSASSHPQSKQDCFRAHYLFNHTPHLRIPSLKWDFPGGSDGEVSVYNVGDLGLIPGLGRFLGEGNGNPLQYSSLENPMDGEALCRLLPMGLQRVGLDWATSLSLQLFERSSNPLHKSFSPFIRH